MSRHRNFKGNNLDYGEEDSHSNSVTDDENYGASPNTMALYMFDELKSGKSRDISNYINYNPSLEISEDCFPDQDTDVFNSLEMTINQDNIPKSVKKFENIKSKKVMDLKKVKDSLTKVCVDNVNPPEILQEKVRGPYDANAIVEAFDNANRQTKCKPLISMIVIGHVDAGKSTLMGNLLYQLRYVSEKKLNKYRHDAQKAGKASFAYAWILDESAEERSRGITTDVGQTNFETKDKKIRLLDAPGHKDFIPNMIAGASQADAALLVVNATKGEFETGFDLGGQTREHTSLIRVFGITSIIVAVNKMDTVNWSKERFEEICEKIKKFMKSVRLTPIFCPVSGLIGTNMTGNITEEFHSKKVMPWYNGPTLIELINKIEDPQRFLEKPLRLGVTDIFKPLGSGTFAISGIVEAGGMEVLSKVLCMPSAIVATVKSIKINTNQTDDSGTCSEINVTHAFDGDQVLLTLSGIDPSLNLEPGSILCNPDYPIACTNRIRAKILVFSLKNNRTITKGSTAIFYFQSINIQAKFEKLHSVTIREGKCDVIKSKPRILPEYSSAEVDLILEKSICIETYENYKHLGKFTLREGGNTIAGGTVIKLLKPKL